MPGSHPSNYVTQFSLNHRTLGSFSDHEPGLWRAVITQALMDAATQSAKSSARRARYDALHWLLSDESDFETVCDNAGLDPDYVRCKAKQALARGCTWRLPVGLGWRRLKSAAENRKPETVTSGTTGATSSLGEADAFLDAPGEGQPANIPSHHPEFAEANPH